MSEPAKRPDSARSPFAGCAILITVVVVVLFLIGFTVLTMFRQFGEIEKFTAAKSAPVPLTEVAANDARVTDLTARLEKFRTELDVKDAKEPAALELSADDLNVAIAAYPHLQELRNTLHVSGIGEGVMRLAISFPLNGMPRLSRQGDRGWLASDPRYLNGTLVAKPQLAKNEFVLGVTAIDVPQGKVAPEFIQQMSPYRIAERYLNDPVLGPAMAKLTRVEIAGDKLVFHRNPGESPVGTVTDEEVDSASRRLFKVLGVAACIFLAFVGLIVIIGTRARARRERGS